MQKGIETSKHRISEDADRLIWSPIREPIYQAAHNRKKRAAVRAQLLSKGKHLDMADPEVWLDQQSLLLPQSWIKPRRVQVAPSVDLFSPEIPETVLKEVFEAMKKTPRHLYQLIIQDTSELLNKGKKLDWTENIWLGLRIRNKGGLGRINTLKKTGAQLKFVLVDEPFDDLSQLHLEGISWVIVGGRRSYSNRLTQINCALAILLQCQQLNIPFCYKGWGDHPSIGQRKLLGRIWNQKPVQQKDIRND
jgi:protein gp37